MINDWSKGSIALFTNGWIVIGAELGFREISRFKLFIARVMTFKAGL